MSLFDYVRTAITPGPSVSQYQDYDWKATPGTCKERIQCYAFSTSPTGDGSQCVISDPLDKYMTKEQLWEALVRWRKVPLRGPATLKMDVEEQEDGTVVTKRLLDADKVKEGHSGLIRKVDASNPVRICHTTFDHEAMTMCRSIFYGDGRSLAHNRDFIRVTTDPLIVEAWRIDLQTGSREVNNYIERFLEDTLNTLVQTNGQESLPDFEDIDMFWNETSALSVLCW